MLMHHSNSMFNGVLTGVKMYFFSVEEHFAAGNLLDSKQHFHQRGLSSSIFTYKSVDFAFIDAEINVVVGQNTARVNFCQILHPQNFFRHVFSLLPFLGLR